jgi:hypothetical protein
VGGGSRGELDQGVAARGLVELDAHGEESGARLAAAYRQERRRNLERADTRGAGVSAILVTRQSTLRTVTRISARISVPPS